MKPYYDDGNGIQIFHGDCREILPVLPKVDLVLTDPPYGISRAHHEASTSTHGGHKGWPEASWDDTRPEKRVFELMVASARDFVIWGGNYFSDYLPPKSGWLVWDKGQRINQSDGELAATSRDGALRIYTLNRVAIAKDGSVHPTQKPLTLMTWCLSFFPETKTCLDPFMGSGTTLRACKDLGIACTGIEQEEAYCEIAARRRAQQVLAL